MAKMSKAAAKVAGATKAMGKALSGYPAIFRHLAGEHGEVATLMKRVSASSDDTQIRADLFPEIRKSLLAHAKAEEKEFYGPLRDFPQTAPMIRWALEDHRKIEECLDQLHAQSSETKTWLQTFERLVSTVEAHVQREEGEMFPAAKDVLTSEQAKEIERRYEAAEEQEKLRI